VSDAGISKDELRDSIRELLQADSTLDLVRPDPARAPDPVDDGRRTHTQATLGELWTRMADLGWFGLAVGEQHGGLGLGLRGLGVLYEELGRFLTPLPVMTTLLAADSVAVAGSDAQKAKWLPEFASGELRATLALPIGAVDLPRLADDYLVSGILTDVLYADQVQQLFVPVQHASGRLYLAIVGSSDPGCTIEPRPLIDLTRTMAKVSLAGVRVPAQCLLPLDEAVWSRILDHASLALACDSVGGAARILEDTVAYLGTRRQFDRPIGSFQALKHRVATWKILVEGISALTRHCADLSARGDAESSALCSSAKASATEAYMAVAGDAVQLHGGIGFTWEHECHLFLKRAKLNAMLFGSVIQHKDRAADFAFAEALGSPDPRRRLLAQLRVCFVKKGISHERPEG
jgi:alkylation response protein AidB-like acyl-CoA dehydrogenase